MFLFTISSYTHLTHVLSKYDRTFKVKNPSKRRTDGQSDRRRE